MVAAAAVLFSLSSAPFVLNYEADSRRGADLFRQQRCGTCHSISGTGAKPEALNAAPDLARRLDRDYTPNSLAARIWNHAPQMFTAIRKAGIDAPVISENDAADLFAFFYATRYFDRPGDAGRGKAVFADKKCGLCHAPNGPALEVAKWQSLRDPVELVERMWNHSTVMAKAAQNRKIPFPSLDARELNDLLVYLQNRPDLKAMPYQFRLPASASGQDILKAKGCTGCHVGKKALDSERIGRRTLTEVAASLWNHAPLMRGSASTLTSNEIREVLAAIWAQGFFRPVGGNPGKGAKIVASRCQGCHGQGGVAPAFQPGSKQILPMSFVSAVWRHGAKMMAAVEKKESDWPRLTAPELAHVTAYLNRGSK